MAACEICEQRRPRRYCPGVRADICARCCGEEREETVDCPLDCEYLHEARLHERSRREVTEELSPDVRISEEFLCGHAILVQWCGMMLGEAALAEPRTVDSDVREAIEAVVRTLRTSATGLIYQTRPANPFAAAIQGKLTEELPRSPTATPSGYWFSSNVWRLPATTAGGGGAPLSTCSEATS
jgi:hypothetical protein